MSLRRTEGLARPTGWRTRLVHPSHPRTTALAPLSGEQENGKVVPGLGFLQRPDVSSVRDQRIGRLVSRRLQHSQVLCHDTKHGKNPHAGVDRQTKTFALHETSHRLLLPGGNPMSESRLPFIHRSTIWRKNVDIPSA